jgi:hypothetical protein
MASAGPGSAPGLYGELFKSMAGVDLAAVNYRGSPAALSDLIAGHVHVMFDPIASSVGYIKSAAPISTRVVMGANSLARSHERLEANEPGHQRPVKAASRLRRSRAARALTGLWWSGSCSPSDHGSGLLSIGLTKARGAHGAIQNFDSECFSDRGCTSAPRVARCRLQKRVCRQTHPTKPTGPHLAAFILPSLGRRSAPRQSRTILRQVAI